MIADVREGVRAALEPLDRLELVRWIEELDEDLAAAGVNVRDYLVLVGIPGRNPAELTPYELGHLFRFLAFFLPRSMNALQQALDRIPTPQGRPHDVRRNRRCARRRRTNSPT